jgi:biopolymer transport protein ExbD
MRLVRRDRRSSVGLALGLASMIDCTFLLLAYFIVTTAGQRREAALQADLGAERRASAGDFAPQIVDVEGAPDAPLFRIGGRAFPDQAALTDALRALPKEPGLHVRVHDGPSVASAAAAMQAGADAGFRRVVYVPAR